MRNLEQIQEDEPGRRAGSKLGALVLASLGGAALVTVGLLAMERSEPPAQDDHDPLAALVKQQRASGRPAEELDEADVTFPGLLSDRDSPTTALAAVKDARGRLVKQDEDAQAVPPLPPGSPSAPPPPTDVLPVVPLPAGDLLSQTPVTADPRDILTEIAADRTRAEQPEGTELAPPGSEGGYQIQVASFKEQGDADKFVDDLRKRGHSAYRQAARVPDRGIWHRVRIGPFKTKFQAIQYKKKFEKTERVSPFIVDPHAVEQRERIKAAKVEARRRKYGKP